MMMMVMIADYLRVRKATLIYTFVNQVRTTCFSKSNRTVSGWDPCVISLWPSTHGDSSWFACGFHHFYHPLRFFHTKEVLQKRTDSKFVYVYINQI